MPVKLFSSFIIKLFRFVADWFEFKKSFRLGNMSVKIKAKARIRVNKLDEINQRAIFSVANRILPLSGNDINPLAVLAYLWMRKISY